MPMSENEARTRLQTMTASSKEPTLTEAELGLLVASAKRADRDGLPPSDAAWTPTWDLNAAAAEGWRWKAAKAAADFDFSEDGQSFKRSQMVAACERMADLYGRRVIGTLPIPGALTVPS